MGEVWTIYKITGACGRAYIGVTKRRICDRWRQHQRDCMNGAQTFLYNAMRKYGVDWFTIQPICECYSAREAKAAERAMITVHNTYAHAGHGFNLTYGGDGNWGWRPSEETKAKIGAKSAERIAANPEYVRKMVDGQSKESRKRPWAAEQARRMGYAKRGTKLTPDQCRAISERLRGHVKSDATLAKMRANRPKGSWKPPQEWVEKMRVAKRGKRLAPEHEAVATAALLRSRHLAFTPEAIDKRREGRKRTGASARLAEVCRIRNADPEFQKRARHNRMYQMALNALGEPARAALRASRASV